MTTPNSSFSIAPSNYPRGSEWRRWDLHVHTPESQLAICFAGVTWDGFVATLETAARDANISAIGVTDYMSINGYEKLLDEKAIRGKLTDIVLLIPNIEFRMMPPTEDGKALNMHLLIDPTEPDHIARIKRALKNLKYEYNGETYGCEQTEIIEFARAQRSDLMDDTTAYKFGLSQFKPDRTKIQEWLDKEAWLRRNCLIGIANGKDGISGLPLDGFGATRDELLRWCDFVFSGNPSDRQHYLGLKPGIPPDEIVWQYGALKPCVHGSDAHEVTALFKPDRERFCWIKSDLTFHGIRQILWEPADRIHIGSIPPQLSDHSQIIRKIALFDTKGWFADDTIELNAGLVAVVGEKGSGKTAIADLAAFAAGMPFEPESQSSFITKGQLHLSEMKVRLEWGNSDITEGILINEPFKVTRPRVRYLSQDFVERLCSSDHEGTELQRAIEEVVFAKLDEVQKEGYSSFRELRTAREAASNIQRENLRGELATLHKEVERLQEALAQREGKVQLREEAEKQAIELKKQLPEAAQFVDQKVLTALEAKQAFQKEIENEISGLTRRRRGIESASKSYAELKKRVGAEIDDIKSILTGAGVGKSTLDKLSPQWVADVDTLLFDEINRLDQEIVKLKGNEKDGEETRSLYSVQQEIVKMKEFISKDEIGRKRLLDLQ